MRRSIAFLFLLACCACSSLEPQRAVAEQATHDWAEPLLRRYLEADPALDDAARATHLRSLDAWSARLRAQQQAQMGAAR